MPNQKQVKIDLPNNIINCFGIQPILVESEIPRRISLFCVNRYKKWSDNATTNNVYYMLSLYENIDAIRIYEKAVRNDIAELYALNVLLNNALHVKINKSLTQLKNDKKELKALLLYYSELLKYRNRLNKGNFFITSDKKIFENISFVPKQLSIYNRYLINPNLLEENIIIVGAKGCMNFDNQIIAVPFINAYDFNNFVLSKNISLPKRNEIEMASKAYPIADYFRKQYDIYSLYLKEKMPLKWHFETFKYSDKFYMVLHLDP